MGKYSGSSTQQKSSISKPKESSGSWRGIGCLMMLIIPAISIFAGIQLVNYSLTKNSIFHIPYQLLGTPQLPAIFHKSSGLMIIFGPLVKIQNLYAHVVISLVLMLVLSSLISFVYAVGYRIMNPSGYGPMDEPPAKIKAKKHSR